MSETLYVVVDADCPGCGWAERRVSLDSLNSPDPLRFECRKCDYVSLERER